MVTLPPMTAITKLSISTGLILTVLGVGLYFGTGMKSATAMIPAFFGVPILICGFLAKDEKKRMMAAHIAALFGVLGTLAGIGRGLMTVIKGNPGIAGIATLVMGLICLFFTIACVRSFIAARKARQA